MHLTLERYCYGFIRPRRAGGEFRFPTLSRLFVGDRVFFGVEDPWNNNESGNSCIPDGLYDLVPHDSEAHPDTWCFVCPDNHVYHWPAEIPEGQHGRFACLLHPGNNESHVKGCLAVGLDPASEPWIGVAHSRDAMTELRNLLVPGTHHTILIRQFRGAHLVA